MENDNNETEDLFPSINNNQLSNSGIINDSNNGLPGRKAETWAPMKEKKNCQKWMLDQAVEMYMDAIKCNAGKTAPLLTFEFLSTFGNPSWMTKHSILFHYKAYKKHNTSINDRSNNPPSKIVTTNRDLTSDSSSSRNKGGRHFLLQTDINDK
jgi:hypothetical protein